MSARSIQRKSGSEVSPLTLVELGLMRKVSDSVRILGNGDLKVVAQSKSASLLQRRPSQN